MLHVGCAKNLGIPTLACLPPTSGRGTLPTPSPRFSCFPLLPECTTLGLLVLPSPKGLPLQYYNRDSSSLPLPKWVPERAPWGPCSSVLWNIPSAWGLSHHHPVGSHTSAVPAPLQGPGTHRWSTNTCWVWKLLPTALFNRPDEGPEKSASHAKLTGFLFPIMLVVFVFF